MKAILATPGATRYILEKYGIKARKKYGQNFLIDANVIRGIIDAAQITEDDCVLEIGPGIGSMTQLLSEAAGKVICVEIDENLRPVLAETLEGCDNVRILWQDILKTDLRAICGEHNGGKPLKVVANLPYYVTTPILMYLLDQKNVDMFLRARVFSEAELKARYEIMTEGYAKEVKIEAMTLLDMVRKDVLPAVSRFCGTLGETALSKKQLLGKEACTYETDLLKKLSELSTRCWTEIAVLSEAVRRCGSCKNAEAFAKICAEELLPSMEKIRSFCDEMETFTDKHYWPYPSYGEILFSVY